MLSDRNVCYLVARVFGKKAAADSSSILDAATWLGDQGAHVINMSLGGGGFSKVADKVFTNLQKAGVLLISSAGNDGTSQIGYPASYDSVMSVGAVDDRSKRADFSNFNKFVGLTAPGVSILSTAPKKLGSIAFVSAGNTDASGMIMANSPTPKAGQQVSGTLVECPNKGSSECPGNGGHICLIERYVLVTQWKGVVGHQLMLAVVATFSLKRRPSTAKQATASPPCKWSCACTGTTFSQPDTVSTTTSTGYCRGRSRRPPRCRFQLWESLPMTGRRF